MATQRTDTIKMLALAGKSVAYTGTAGDITQPIRGDCLMFWTTTDAWVAIGQTALTTNAIPVPAFTPMFVPIPQSTAANPGFNQGETPSVLISAVQISAGGTLFMAQFS